MRTKGKKIQIQVSRQRKVSRKEELLEWSKIQRKKGMIS